MAKTFTSTRPGVRYPDSLLTDDRGLIRLSNLNGGDEVTFNGVSLKVRDIPQNYATLTCSHGTRGIALTAGDLVFCEHCGGDQRVVKVRQ